MDGVAQRLFVAQLLEQTTTEPARNAREYRDVEARRLAARR